MEGQRPQQVERVLPSATHPKPQAKGSRYLQLEERHAHILGATGKKTTAGGEKEPATTHAQNPKGPIAGLHLPKLPETAPLCLSCSLTEPALEGSEEVASQGGRTYIKSKKSTTATSPTAGL